MTDPTPHALERELELARAAYTPRADLRERVLDKLLHGPGMTAGSSAASGGRVAAPPGPRWLRVAAPKALAVVGLVALGFGAGWQANRAYQQPPPLPSAPSVDAPDAIVMPEPVALPVDASDGFVAAPLANEATARLAPPGRASHPSARRVARGTPSHTPGSADARSQPSPARLDDGSTREELALLQRAERAVRAGNAALGLALIAELEAGYPRSKLLEERRAVELMAHCAAGATDSRARAERFLREQPRSIYAVRIDELCSASRKPSQR